MSDETEVDWKADVRVDWPSPADWLARKPWRYRLRFRLRVLWLKLTGEW